MCDRIQLLAQGESVCHRPATSGSPPLKITSSRLVMGPQPGQFAVGERSPYRLKALLLRNRSAAGSSTGSAPDRRRSTPTALDPDTFAAAPRRPRCSSPTGSATKPACVARSWGEGNTCRSSGSWPPRRRCGTRTPRARRSERPDRWSQPPPPSPAAAANRRCVELPPRMACGHVRAAFFGPATLGTRPVSADTMLMPWRS